MAELRICIDVEDVDQAIEFYTTVFDLKLGRRFDLDWAELLGACAPIDLLGKRSGTAPYSNAANGRRYDRHWTPTHLDFVVQDIDQAVALALQNGATLDRPIQTHVYGRLALLADPFGNGFCFLQFTGQGYGEVVQD